MIVTGLIIALLFNEWNVVAEKENLCYIFPTDRIDPWAPIEGLAEKQEPFRAQPWRRVEGGGIFLFGFPVTH